MGLQDDLAFLEADEDRDSDFLSGSGEPQRGLQHFPRLWCPAGQYSTSGQIFLVPLSQVGVRA